MSDLVKEYQRLKKSLIPVVKGSPLSREDLNFNSSVRKRMRRLRDKMTTAEIMFL